MRVVELLSPAKSAEHGIEAVNHGADAVYIGAPKFGARAAVGNSVEEIERLASYAHRFRAKVYVALNTILTDKELAETEKMVRQIYEAGADALIVQDMGITQLDLPPIALHASTQMDNRSVEKVRFLEEAGFDQVVLARELSFEQIRQISAQTKVKLEAFVHGALCVSYSGQCYLSQAVCGRSANRGVCAQLCRLPYSLYDAENREVVRNKHLLSLKDFNLSDSLKDLIEAGVSSLKIEGRLKDISYVKNVTAYYRQKLDALLEGSPDYKKASSGNCTYLFEPKLEKSFHRGFTTYFTKERTSEIGAFDTPKSKGEYVGIVTDVTANSLTVATDLEMSNGDGFAYMNEQGEFAGFKVNRAEGNVLFPSDKVCIRRGTAVFRNYDHQFEKVLSKKSAVRKVRVNMTFAEIEGGFALGAICEDGCEVSLKVQAEKVEAQNKDKARDVIVTQLAKTGNTIYDVNNVDMQTDKMYFIPAGVLSEWRRQIVELLEEERERKRDRGEGTFPQTSHQYGKTELDYRGNVHNSKAADFYKSHGVSKIARSFESSPVSNAELMRCKHCIKFSLGYCPKQGGKGLKEPLSLVSNKGDKFKLEFDCKNCEMLIRAI
jgi:putative protease